MVFNKEKYLEFVLSHGVVQFHEKPVQLKSKKMSHLYINFRRLSDSVGLIDTLSEFLISFVEEKKIKGSFFIGVPEGATKLSTVSTYKWAMRKNDLNSSLVMGRAKPKEHGESLDKYFIGQPMGSAIVIEDTTTTGNSLVEFLDKLKAAHIEIAACITLTNRLKDESALRKKLKDPYQTELYSLSSAKELVQGAFKKNPLSEELRSSILQEV